jgi:molybdopterin-guanine dinucleotide biosynthesis protein A
MSSLPALILAGGHSVRMGRDKRLLDVRGRRMIDVVAATTARVSSTIRFVGSPPAGFDASLWIPDAMEDAGPLAGLVAGLGAIQDDRALVLAADMPLVTAEALEFLIAHHTLAAAVVAFAGGRAHYLCGVYSKACIAAAALLLESPLPRDRSMHRLAGIVGAELLSMPENKFDASMFESINTPEQYERLISQ